MRFLGLNSPEIFLIFIIILSVLGPRRIEKGWLLFQKLLKYLLRNEEDLNYTLNLIKKNNIIKECYQKAQHYINLASNSLSLFSDCEEKKILKNLTSFTLARNF